jgi:hypothetical protein
MNFIPLPPNGFGVLSICRQYVPILARWRIFHVPSTIEFQTADIFIAYPHMHVRRLEVVLPCIDDKPELSIFNDGRHNPPEITYLSIIVYL